MLYGEVLNLGNENVNISVGKYLIGIDNLMCLLKGASDFGQYQL